MLNLPKLTDLEVANKKVLLRGDLDLPRRSSAEAGQASRLLLVLAIIVLVAAVIVFLVMKMAEKPAAPSNNPVTTVPVPVYDQQLGNIRFIFESCFRPSY